MIYVTHNINYIPIYSDKYIILIKNISTNKQTIPILMNLQRTSWVWLDWCWTRQRDPARETCAPINSTSAKENLKFYIIVFSLLFLGNESLRIRISSPIVNLSKLISSSILAHSRIAINKVLICPVTWLEHYRYSVKHKTIN